MAEPMRRVLMVAYHFPPVGGVGVERTLKHATYLPDHGWEAVVVAPSHSAYRIIDPASVARVPAGLEVHRGRTVEPAHLRQLVGRVVRRGGVDRSTAGSNPVADGAPKATGLRARVNAAWAFLVPRIFFPDEQLLWIPGAVLAGARAHRRSPIHAVYSSSPPISGHLAAAMVARRLGVPWIADFRDPWIGNAFAGPLPRPHRAAQRWLESRIVHRADRVVLATERYRAQYANRYPWLADRFVHIPNGYDLDELLAYAPPMPARSGGPFRLIYAGSVYGTRELDLFLDGLQLALERDDGLRDRLRVEFVGWLSQANQAIASERLPSLEPVVSHLGFRPRAEAIALERSADAGLIIMADGPGREAVVAAKLYEYLGLDLPVLAVAPEGETRDILHRLEWGVGADPTPEGVAEGIARITSLPRPDRVADPDRAYERRSLTARIARLLEDVTR